MTTVSPTVGKEVGKEEEEEEYDVLPDDVYTLFFISENFGSAFFYSFYIFALKMIFFGFLATEAIRKLEGLEPLDRETQGHIIAVQFLIIPVAVGIQSDLISTYTILSNLKYWPDAMRDFPNATKPKYYVSNICRGMDGLASLLVNFVILLTAGDILSIFLNFAALQFLQGIDNMALDLAVSGYLTEYLEEMSTLAKDVKLPQNHNACLRSMDSVGLFITMLLLVFGWAYWQFGDHE